jgi:hypothetical protein
MVLPEILVKVSPLCFINTAEAFAAPNPTEVSGVNPSVVATNGPIAIVATVSALKKCDI